MSSKCRINDERTVENGSYRYLETCLLGGGWLIDEKKGTYKETSLTIWRKAVSSSFHHSLMSFQVTLFRQAVWQLTIFPHTICKAIFFINK